jgi:hypothetical protein
MSSEQAGHIQARKTPGGWRLELDNLAWAQIMTALSIAIETCDQVRSDAGTARAAVFKELRSAMSNTHNSPSGYPLTYRGNAERLMATHGDQIRYAPHKKGWFCLEDGTWKHDVDATHVQGLVQELAEALGEGVPWDKRNPVYRHTLRSGMIYGINATMREAAILSCERQGLEAPQRITYHKIQYPEPDQ